MTTRHQHWCVDVAVVYMYRCPVATVTPAVSCPVVSERGTCRDIQSISLHLMGRAEWLAPVGWIQQFIRRPRLLTFLGIVSAI